MSTFALSSAAADKPIIDPIAEVSSEQCTDGNPEEQINRLKAEVKQLQMLVRRMSTVDMSAGARSAAAALQNQKQVSSHAFLFDSFDESSYSADISRLTEENTKLQQENEDLRGEIESLKELCATNKSGLASLSAEELCRIEKTVSIKLIKEIGNSITTVLQNESLRIAGGNSSNAVASEDGNFG